MHWHFLAAVLMLLLTTPALAQPPATLPGEPDLPSPGARGNADNVPYIGKSDPRGNPVRLARATGHVSNYSEEKISPYRLPDPLAMSSGERVTTAEQWLTQRRPEILKFYQTEIYGRVPQSAPKVTWQVTETDEAAATPPYPPIGKPSSISPNGISRPLGAKPRRLQLVGVRREGQVGLGTGVESRHVSRDHGTLAVSSNSRRT